MMHRRPSEAGAFALERALGYLAWGRTSRGVAALFEALEQGGDCHVRLCEALCILDRWDEAVPVAERAPGEQRALLLTYLELDRVVHAQRFGSLAPSSAVSSTGGNPSSALAWWVRGLEALVAREYDSMASSFGRGVEVSEHWWQRASMFLCLALDALERGEQAAARRWMNAYLQHFDASGALHPGRVRADRHLLLLWGALADVVPLEPARVVALDREVDGLLEQGMRTTPSELAVLRAAQDALATYCGEPQPSLQSLVGALAEDLSGCLVKRAFVQPRHLLLARRGAAPPRQG